MKESVFVNLEPAQYQQLLDILATLAGAASCKVVKGGLMSTTRIDATPAAFARIGARIEPVHQRREQERLASLAQKGEAAWL